jgi:hypothetical protein
MLIEQISLACRHCGGAAVKSLSWNQAHRHFRCRRCGRSYWPAEKPREAAVPVRLDAKEEAANLSRLPIYGV